MSSNFEIVPANSYRNPQRQGNLKGATTKHDQQHAENMLVKLHKKIIA